MLPTLSFESSALVTDDVFIAARISSLFRRPRRYFPVMAGPRMERPDADNEVTRCRNALVMAGTTHLLVGSVAPRGAEPLSVGWRRTSKSDEYEELVEALRGDVKQSDNAFIWGHSNLGVGLYLARLQRKRLELDQKATSSQCVVERGTHLLVACEQGDELAQIIACSLAFPWDASFATFPALSKDASDAWIEELYELGEGVDVTNRFRALVLRARESVGLDFGSYKNILFITRAFPWGIGFQNVPTTHMRGYSDLGRAAISGLWASHSSQRSVRTALLIDPKKVEGSEIKAIGEALLRNGTLVV